MLGLEDSHVVFEVGYFPVGGCFARVCEFSGVLFGFLFSFFRAVGRLLLCVPLVEMPADEDDDDAGDGCDERAGEGGDDERLIVFPHLPYGDESVQCWSAPQYFSFWPG